METRIKLNKRGLNSVEVYVQKEYDENYNICEWAEIAEFYNIRMAEEFAKEIRQIEATTLQEFREKLVGKESINSHDIK